MSCIRIAWLVIPIVKRAEVLEVAMHVKAISFCRQTTTEFCATYVQTYQIKL